MCRFYEHMVRASTHRKQRLHRSAGLAMAREHSVQDSKYEVYTGCMLPQGEECDLQQSSIVTARIRGEQCSLV